MNRSVPPTWPIELPARRMYQRNDDRNCWILGNSGPSILRDVFANLFRSITVVSSWLTPPWSKCLDGTVMNKGAFDQVWQVWLTLWKLPVVTTAKFWDIAGGLDRTSEGVG